MQGIRAVAKQADPIGKLVTQTELAEDLVLDKICCPIGVLLVIFESRPDCLPQIASLALRSGNGLVLKGGKEAEQTNGCLYGIVRDAIRDATDGTVSSDAIGLVQSHDQINGLLKLGTFVRWLQFSLHFSESDFAICVFYLQTSSLTWSFLAGRMHS